MISRIPSLAILFSLLFLPISAKEVIRVGTLAPKGSSWHRILSQMGAEIKQATKGEVILRIYPGGIVGDEAEMIRKMRIGQLHAAAISNAGVGGIDSSAYALSLPLKFQSYEEWDFVRNKINPDLEAKMRKNGFEVLTWSDVGWVYFFSKKPLVHPDQLKTLKLATSADESSMTDILKWAGFNPIPITTVDRLTGLQTGLIDTVYMPAILAEGSQLFRYAPHATDMKWAPLQGALVMTEKRWKKLSPEQQSVILSVTRKLGADLRSEARQQEQKSLEAMKGRGLTIHPIDVDARKAWLATTEQAYPKVRDTLVPGEMLDRVDALCAEFRAQEE